MFVLFVTRVTPTLAQVVLDSVIPSSSHAHERLSLILFDFSFYIHPHFLVFFLSFLSMYSDDFDSVTNNLRDSANGNNDGYDVAFPLTRIGRPDILRSVNKLARSITKWTKACDKRLNRLISNVHHTCEYKQYCHVGNTAKQYRLGLFQDSSSQEILKIQNPLQEKHCEFLEVIQLFQ